MSKSMDSLVLAYNRIDTLGNLSRAPNLTILDVHNNKLSLLPEDISELTKLKTLKVSNNDLSDLDPRISLLPDLVRINIEGNPLKSIKSSMRGAGAVELKKYLKFRLSEDVVAKTEIDLSKEKGLPMSSNSYDAWDMFLREFTTNGQSLDLKNKNLNSLSPKIWL